MFLLLGGLEIEFFSPQSLFILHIHNFAVQVTAQWSRLPREVMESPSLEIFMNHLGCNPVPLGRRCLNREVGPKGVFSKLTHSMNHISHARFLLLSLEPLSHQQGERKTFETLQISTTCCALFPQFCLQTVGFGMQLGCFGWFEFFEGCLFVYLYTERYF